MTKFKFQETAIEALCENFKRLWRAPGRRLPLVFKSPTGSGKTFMVTSFINGLSSVEPFDEDVAWIWITFSDDLAMQSREKFNEYFFPNGGRRLLTVADLDEGVLRRNDVLFLNWQKVVSRKAENRVLRRPAPGEPAKESGCYFEDLIEATHAAGRQIAMVIDESHQHVSEAAERDVIGPADPKVVVHVSATPKFEPTASDVNHGRAGLVEVDREAVVAAGLIKEAIVSQTEEELASGSDEADTDAKLLDLAMRRRAELAAAWREAGHDVNPLVLVQLPDDDKDLESQGVPTKESVVRAYLAAHGVPEGRIASWFSGRRENMDGISENGCPVDYLLFKCAAGTGWDCPRAQVLVMFREIKTPTFRTQTLGRIVRNPVPHADLAKRPALRLGYLYTNYARSDVETGASKGSVRVLTRHAALIPSLCGEIGEGQPGYVVDANLRTEFVSRADYGDLGKASEFQSCFVRSMDAAFGIAADDLLSARSARVAAAGVDLAAKLTSSVIANVEWRSDGTDGVDGGTNVEAEVSANDVEKTFTRACIALLAEQADDAAKVTNIARSAGVFRAAVRKWLADALPDVADETGRYRVFLADLAKDAASAFRPAVADALKAYAPVRRKFVDARKKREEARPPEVFALRRGYSYADDCEEYAPAALSAVQPLFLPKEYPGRANETAFIAYLEQRVDKVVWWFKNGSGGADSFGLKYLNTAEGRTRLFYPDWIVRLKDGRIGIFDTKGGATAKSPEGREAGLRDRIAAMNAAAGCERFFGGLVVREGGQWLCHDGKDYAYIHGSLDAHWRRLGDLM